MMRSPNPLINILYAGDFLTVMLIVKEMLELEGWGVEACGDGGRAPELIESGAPFDLIPLDDDLPGLSGIGVIVRAASHTGAARR